MKYGQYLSIVLFTYLIRFLLGKVAHFCYVNWLFVRSVVRLDRFERNLISNELTPALLYIIKNHAEKIHKQKQYKKKKNKTN